MIEHATQQRTKAGGPGTALGPNPMVMCPVGKMCEGMMKKPPSGYLAMIAGILLIIVGALIFIEPRILVWLAGAALVLIGVMLLMMARFIRRIGASSTL